MDKSKLQDIKSKKGRAAAEVSGNEQRDRSLPVSRRLARRAADLHRNDSCYSSR